MARKNSAAAEVGPMPERKMSLVDIVDNIEQLCILLETAASEDERKVAEQELQRAVFTELSDKVDGFGWFKKRNEATIASLKQAKLEVARDIDRAVNRFEDRWERLRALAKFALERSNLSSLKGHVYTISLCPGKDSLSVFNAEQVPDRFRKVTVCLRADVWERMRVLPYTDEGGEMTPIDDNVRSFTYAVDEQALRDALEAKEEVPGAELKPGVDYIRVS